MMILALDEYCSDRRLIAPLDSLHLNLIVFSNKVPASDIKADGISVWQKVESKQNTNQTIENCSTILRESFCTIIVFLLFIVFTLVFCLREFFFGVNEQLH